MLDLRRLRAVQGARAATGREPFDLARALVQSSRAPGRAVTVAAHNWEIVRDIHLARMGLLKDGRTVERLELELSASQAACTEHVPNPEARERCYKCGAPTDEARPGLRKAVLEVANQTRRAS